MTLSNKRRRSSLSNDKKQSLVQKRIQLLQELISATKTGKVSWDTTAENGFLVASKAMTLHIVPLVKEVHWGYRVELADGTGSVVDQYSVEKCDSSAINVLTQIGMASDEKANLELQVDKLYIAARDSIEAKINLQMDRFIEGLRA